MPQLGTYECKQNQKTQDDEPGRIKDGDKVHGWDALVQHDEGEALDGRKEEDGWDQRTEPCLEPNAVGGHLFGKVTTTSKRLVCTKQLHRETFS